MIEAENLKLGNEGMSEYQYTIILHPDTDEGGYTVTVPALPGCVTQGGYSWLLIFYANVC